MPFDNMEHAEQTPALAGSPRVRSRKRRRANSTAETEFDVAAAHNESPTRKYEVAPEGVHETEPKLSKHRQLELHQPDKKRKKHASQAQTLQDNPAPPDMLQGAQQEGSLPDHPDGKRKKKNRRKSDGAAALHNPPHVTSQVHSQHVESVSVSDASNVNHASRPPNSRHHTPDSAEQVSNKQEQNQCHAAATAADDPDAAAAGIAQQQPEGSAGANPMQSGSEQAPDASAQAERPNLEATGLPGADADTSSEQQPQATAKRKPGRPKGSGRKAVLQQIPAVKKQLGRPKGFKNKPKQQNGKRVASGTAVKVTQLARSKPKCSTPHPTFQGVWKTPPATRKIPPGVDCVWTAQVVLPDQKGKVILGRSYWTAEAAARASDRAQLAVHGRETAVLNFPLEWYDPEEVQRHGPDLDKHLSRLSGWECNNPLNAPGVPHIPWVHARTRIRLQPGWQPKKELVEPDLVPALGIKVREHVTGVPASSEGVFEPARNEGVAWHNKPCGRCTACKLSAFQKRNDAATSSETGCEVVVQMRAARAELLRQAKASGQQRFEPADLPAFLSTLKPASTDCTAPLKQQQQPDKAAVAVHVLTDPEAVKPEKRGGPRRKKTADELVETCMKASRMPSAKDGRSGKKRQSQKAMLWPQARLKALQVREEALRSAQEQPRRLAADTAPNRGIYQPLLTSTAAAFALDASQTWPDHAAVDLRHVARQAEKAELVEVQDHMRWAPPAMGLLGAPADPPQPSQAAAPTARPSSQQGRCLWCQARDHVIGQCPLNAYASEHFPPAAKHKAGSKQGPAPADLSTSAAHTSLDGVPAEVKVVMHAMQQMASVAMQINVAQDPCHNDLQQSLSPDALLACGLLVSEVVAARTNGVSGGRQ